ncbi:hypothetical protein [Saliniramus fredricksonii]|uniref:hypothetical protein n=1 Tax=Saliniramus fredricksonii TaxID=1653334 RepID=UPI0010426351|nr:hypothetical protein [Saliniramus fredricksonii]
MGEELKRLCDKAQIAIGDLLLSKVPVRFNLLTSLSRQKLFTIGCFSFQLLDSSLGRRGALTLKRNNASALPTGYGSVAIARRGRSIDIDRSAGWRSVNVMVRTDQNR